jgi:hypothetical protein
MDRPRETHWTQFRKWIPHFFVVVPITLRVVAAVRGSYCLLCILYIHYLSTITMPVGGGFARFLRMPPPRKEGDAVVESVKETPVSQKHDSKVDSDMQPWTDSIVDEAPNGFDNFGDDFGIPTDSIGGGVDFDNNVDESLTGGWGATEVCNELLNVMRSLQNCR